MIYDQQEEIENISWNVSGKIVSLTRIVGSQKADLEFEYDAMGNRIVKRVIPKNPDGTKNMTAIKTTYYVRDAQSNIMASYTQTNTQEIALEEQPIYGSSRLGVYHPTTETGIVRGNRIYEGSNHLGNVLVTFSDRIVFENGDLKPATVSYSDYYAFGMPIKTRTNAARLYKSGFNGKENDKEIGAGFQDYGFREYDNRIGRFMSIDPMAKKGPWISPYAYCFDNPIWFIDSDGQWPLFSHYRMTKRALIKVGVSKDIAKKIAYYSATYADGAKGGVLIANQILGVFVGVNPKNLAKKSTDDTRYDDSQVDDDPEMATVHSMRAYNEDISPEEAVERTRQAYGEIFDKYSDVDINTLGDDEEALADLGVAFHMTQDVSAHNGRRWVYENKKYTTNENEHKLLFTLAETFTMSRRQARADTKQATSKINVGSSSSFELPKQKLILGSEGGQ